MLKPFRSAARTCWRALSPRMPGPVRRLLKAALRPGVPQEETLAPDDLCLQLDAILRELRRLHVRLEELETRLGELQPVRDGDRNAA
jgi:hypothetical protein